MSASMSCMARGASGSGNEWTPGTESHGVDVQGHRRDFLLHVPASRVRNRFGIAQPYPLIIALHGSGADGETVRRQSGLDSVADAKSWLVAYPNAVAGNLGLGSDWNAGTCCGAASRDSVNDVQFILAVIDSLASVFPINRKRVYVAGFSDGARMAYHLACDAAASIAAVSIVSGSLRDSTCVPVKPVPMIAFHGTEDDEVPYAEPPDSPLRKPPIRTAQALPPSVQRWASANGCRGLRQTLAATDVTRYSFTRCKAAVEMYSVAGGGHGWPGEPHGVGAEPPMSEISATDIMVRFFSQISR